MSKIIGCLRAAGMTVDFIGDREAEDPHYAAGLEEAVVTVAIGLEAAVSHLSRHGLAYKTVLVSRPETFHKYIAAIRAFALKARVLYDTVDLHWVRLARAAPYVGQAVQCIARSDHYKRLELVNARLADVTVTVSEKERSTLLDEQPDLDVRIIPIIHDVVDRVAPFGERRDLLFIGGFLHLPNVDAVRYFVADILPLVIERLPEVRLRIVGSNMPVDILGLGSANVEPVGFVEDAEPIFQESRVFVAPLRHGAGMKGKVCHSLSLGLPVVTTGIGAEGIGLVDGENGFICNQAADFAAAVVSLYTDETLWSKFSEAGRDLVRKRYSTRVVQKQLLALLES